MAQLARGAWLVQLAVWCLLLLALDELRSPESKSWFAAAVQDDEASCTASGTCELDLKLLIAAGKKLTAEAEALVTQPDEAMGIKELSRVWRLVRNQQNLVNDAFQSLNEKFSNTIRSISGIVTIRTEVASDLTDLFYGGEPFMVQCVSVTDTVNRVFIEAANDLSAAGVTPAALDCNAQLPSGKTTFERFFEGKKHEEPFFFYTANRLKPRSFILKPHVTPEMLVAFSLNATKPKFTKVTNQEDLRSVPHVHPRTPCALFLSVRTRLVFPFQHPPPLASFISSTLIDASHMAAQGGLSAAEDVRRCRAQQQHD